MSEPAPFPTRRRRIFDPPPELADLRAAHPVCPVAMPDGGDAWIATGHAEVRAALADPRWSARQDLRLPPPGAPVPQPAAPGFFVRMDAPEHTRYRRHVSRHFSQRRIRALEPTIVRLVDALLDEMEGAGAPVDLVAVLGEPLPAAVVSSLLGIDDLDAERFAAASRVAVDLTATPAEVAEALSSIAALLRDLVAACHRDRREGLVAALVAEDLTDDEVVGIAQLLLIAGHETTSNMIALGVFALLCHPDQLDAFREAIGEGPERDGDFEGAVARAVDELLRYLTVNTFGAMRVAHEPVELAGVSMPAHGTLVCSLAAANRDPAVFERPDELDVRRPSNPHVAFGHGPHLCSGRQLARLELQIALARLWRRFPNLALAEAPRAVPLRLDMSVYGVRSLPVTW